MYQQGTVKISYKLSVAFPQVPACFRAAIFSKHCLKCGTVFMRMVLTILRFSCSRKKKGNCVVFALMVTAYRKRM